MKPATERDQGYREAMADAAEFLRLHAAGIEKVPSPAGSNARVATKLRECAEFLQDIAEGKR